MKKYVHMAILLALCVLFNANPLYSMDSGYKNSGIFDYWKYDLYGGLDLKNPGNALKLDFQKDHLSDYANYYKNGFGWAFNTSKRDGVSAYYTETENSSCFNAGSNGAGTASLNGTNFITAAGEAYIHLWTDLKCFDIEGVRNIERSKEIAIDLLYGLKFIKAVFKAVDRKNGSIISNYSVSSAIPEIGLGATASIDRNLNLYGNIMASSFSLSGASAVLRSAEGGLDFKIFCNKHYRENRPHKPEWHARAGYRAQYISIEDSSNKIKMEYRGPILAIEAKF